MACGSFGQQKCRSSEFRKHIMDKVNIFFPVNRPQLKQFDLFARPDVPAPDCRGAAELYMSCLGDKPPEHPDWIRDRRAFRAALDGMGNLRRWLHNKPILTDLEVIVLERDRQNKRISSLSSERSINPPSPPEVATSPHALKCEVEEVKSFLDSAWDLSKLLDWNGTGILKRADLCAQFKKEGFFIHPKRLNTLMSSLNSKDGNSVTAEDLAVGIQAWRRKQQEREEQKSNPDREKEIWSGHQHEEETEGQEGMQDVEVLAIMRRVLATIKISCPSSLSCSMGREVDQFRRLCFRQYLKSMELCQQQGLNVSQTTLQKVLLHPGDMRMSDGSKLGRNEGHFLGCGRQEQALTCGAEDGARKGHKKMKKKIRWADPDAFWPGKEDHVRLFLPAMTRSPAMVLFQRIERSVVPSRGHWPVNHLGYSTSGDIEARKMYTL